MHSEFGGIERHARLMRGQNVSTEHLLEFQRVKRKLLKSPACRNTKTGKGAAVQNVAHGLLDCLKIVRCLGTASKIGHAKDTAQALLKAGPGDLYRHCDEQAPRQHLDGNVTQITQRLLHVPDQAAQKYRAISALNADFTVMHHNVLLRLTHSPLRSWAVED
jgi:hypothetical protein